MSLVKVFSISAFRDLFVPTVAVVSRATTCHAVSFLVALKEASLVLVVTRSTPLVVRYVSTSLPLLSAPSGIDCPFCSSCFGVSGYWV